MIVQISDLNISENTYSKIEYATGSLIELLNKIDNPVLLISGGIFATRAYLNNKDINFFHKFLLRLEDYPKVITLGSSDIGSQAFDEVSAKFAVLLKNLPNTYFIDDQKLITVAGIVFSYQKLDQNTKIDYMITVKPPDAFKGANLGMFRGVIGSGRPRAFIEANLAYAGNFVQNNPRDGIVFGAVVWRGNDPKFIPLRQEYVDLYLEYTDNTSTINLPKVNVRNAYLVFRNCSADFMEMIGDALTINYACKIHVINNDMIEIPLSNKFDLDYHNFARFEQAIREKKCPCADSVINHMKTELKIEKHIPAKWKINYLCWDNVYSYKESNYISFLKRTDEEMKIDSNLSFIVGKNKSGKTSIIDIIFIIIANVFLRGDVENVINQKKDKAFIKCSLEIDSREFIIERQFLREDKKISERYVLISENKDISEDNIKKTYEKLHSIMNFKYSYFQQNFVSNTLLTDMKLTEKRNFAINILKMDYLKGLMESVRAKKKYYTAEAKKYKSLFENKGGSGLELQNEFIQLKRDIDETVKYFSPDVALLRTKWNSFNETIQKMREKKIEIPTIAENAGDLSDMKEFYTEYYSCLENIPISILKDAFGELIKTINKFLTLVADFRLSAKFTTNNFELYTVVNNQTLPASMGSGYQKFLIDILIRIVFLRSLNISGFDTLYIDEGFGCLDSENFIKISKAIEKLKEYHKIMIITHIDELKTYSSSHISVNNKVQSGTLTEDERGFHALHESKKKKSKKS